MSFLSSERGEGGEDICKVCGSPLKREFISSSPKESDHISCFACSTRNDLISREYMESISGAIGDSSTAATPSPISPDSNNTLREQKKNSRLQQRKPKVKRPCNNCKQRRIKCDEQRPECYNCVRSKRACSGYPPPARNIVTPQGTPKPKQGENVAMETVGLGVVASIASVLAVSHDSHLDYNNENYANIRRIPHHIDLNFQPLITFLRQQTPSPTPTPTPTPNSLRTYLSYLSDEAKLEELFDKIWLRFLEVEHRLSEEQILEEFRKIDNFCRQLMGVEEMENEKNLDTDTTNESLRDLVDHDEVVEQTTTCSEKSRPRDESKSTRNKASLKPPSGGTSPCQPADNDLNGGRGNYNSVTKKKVVGSPQPSAKSPSTSKSLFVLEDVDIDESYVSDLESILSDAPSLASSQSSMPIDINTGAVDELRSLLLLNKSLKPLYEEAIHKVGAEKFQRNFRRLLLLYGRALGSEASTPLQVKAARFVRFAAFRVSVQIKNSLVSKDEQVNSYTQQDEARSKVLAYLKQREEAESSEDESIYDPEEATGLQTLESVKNFMVSSKAFHTLCISLKDWLNPGHEVEQRPLANAEENTETNQENTGHSQENAGHCQEISLSCQQNSGSPERKSKPFQEEPGLSEKRTWLFENRTDVSGKEPGTLLRESRYSQDISGLLHTQLPWKQYRNAIFDLFSCLRRVPEGYVRVSWTCRCGDRLRIQVPEAQHQAAAAFAQHAAGPNLTTISSQTSHISTQSSSSSLSITSSTGGSPTSRPESPNTTISSDSDANITDQPCPFIPAGTKQYMLLVVNTRTPRSFRPIRKLVNVDVTDVTCGGELFRRLQAAYYNLRSTSSSSRFTVPRTMHYVKLQLIQLSKSGAVVGPYEKDSIPCRKKVQNQEYAFSPCPPKIGPLPMPPDIFMHSFLDPTDHFGPMAVTILPKKLHCQLSTGGAETTGWGYYIVEGINWPLVCWFAVMIVISITILTTAWCVFKDAQAGTGIGQYCIAVVAVPASVWALYISMEKSQ